MFGGFVLTVTAPYRYAESTTTLFSGTVGGLYLVTGLVASLRRPDNPVGLVMVLVGIAWFAEDLQISASPPLHTVGMLVRTASDGFLVHLLLIFPGGRLRSTADRVLVAAGYVATFVLAPFSALFIDSEVPNLLLVRAAGWPQPVVNLVQIGLAAAVVGTLLRRWLAASPPARRVILPVYAAGLVGGVESVLDPVLATSHWTHVLLRQVGHVAFVLLPLAFLAGVWRIRLGRTPVAAFLLAMRGATSEQLQDLLATTLGDPTLLVGYVRAGRGDYVDRHGRPLTLPPGQAVTSVTRHGRRIAVLSHDPALLEDRYVLDAVVSAAALELDNQRLAVEVQARALEARTARSRIVTAVDEQRRRVERDLHDGAQQQLVTSAMTLRMARQRLDANPDPELTRLVERSMASVQNALCELRELARGIHPTVLSEAGLVPALRALAARTPCPIELRAPPLPTLPAPLAATAYFVAAEAVTNALKHAHASTIRIDVAHDRHDLRLSVTDDGVGGAEENGGTGLRGLRERVSALDGELTIRSPPGVGTAVCVRLRLDGP